MVSSAPHVPSRPLRRLLGVPLLALGVALLVGAALAPTASVAAAVAQMVDATWMDVPPLPDDLRELAVRSAITDRDGNRIATVRDENRVLADGERIPEHVREAVVATEDQEFYEHEGVDWQAVARAAFGNVRAGEVTAGGSTVTQQLVKNIVITEPGERAEQSLERKITEAVYAIELEERLPKTEILNHYLNTAYFANGVYGIATAAEYYWAKEVEELTVDEAALLAGMLRSPERLDPSEEPAAARSRRNVVLAQMADVGFLGQIEAQQLAKEPIETEPREGEQQRSRDAVVDFVLEVVKGQPDDDRLPGIAALGDTPEERFNRLATGGYEIRTTLHGELQQHADEAIRRHLSADQEGHAALTAVDPRTGQLLAMGFGPRAYGEEGADFHPGVPGLGSPGRQSGSAFKAFGVVAALEDGVPPTYTANPPAPYRPVPGGHCPGDFRPHNYADGAGGQMDLYEATARSSNVYFAHLVDEVSSPGRLAEVASRMGVPNVNPYCASVLGTDNVYVMDMASAFGTLANGGERCSPHAILEIVDRHGDVVYEADDDCERVLGVDTAARAVDILRGPIERGTASRHGNIGRPAAGKTGTSQNFGNAWFVGFVPQLSTAVWAGNERDADALTHPNCPSGVTGGCVPTQVWASFMTQAVRTLELPAEGFPSPPPLPTTTVPDVVGSPREAAVADLDAAGFAAQTREVEHHAEVGTVVDQSPAGGAQAPARSAVVLEVSDGTGEPPTVPNVVGLERDEALAALREGGFEVEEEQVAVTDTDDVGTVVRQSPEAGAAAEDGHTVRLGIGRPPRGGEPAATPSPSPRPTTGPDPQPTAEPEPSPAPSPVPTEEPDDDVDGLIDEPEDEDSS